MFPGAPQRKAFVASLLYGLTLAAGLSSAFASTPSALLSSAQTAIEAKDYTAGRRLLEEALQQQPNSAQALFMMADLAMRTNNPPAAIGYFRRGLRLQPHSFAGHYELALAYLRLKSIQNGLRELRLAVSLDPGQGDAVYNLGLVLLETGNAREAIDRLQQARALGNERPDLSYNLARAELDAHQPQAAIEEATRAALLGQDSRWRQAMGTLFLAAHQPQAVSLLLPAPAASEDYFLLASAALMSGNLDAAAQLSARSLEAEPRDERYLLLSARIDQQRGHQEAALQTLAAASPSPEVLYSQAVSYYYLARYDQVRQTLDHARELSSSLSARALFLYAMSYENEGRAENASLPLRQAVALEPANARFHCHLGVALLAMNQVGSAQQEFAAAERLKPDFALPHYEAGKVLARAQKYAAAAKELGTATRLQPDLAPALYEQSRVYTALGEKQLAGTALAQFLALRKKAAAEQEELASDASRQLQLQ